MKAYEIIKNAKNLVFFTGAGISVESGIRPFRGKDGLYDEYGDKLFDRNWYLQNTKKAIGFYNDIFFNVTYKPNKAHEIIARMNKSAIITMNIDNLHQIAGDADTITVHGNTANMKCVGCGKIYPIEGKILNWTCECGKTLKPTLTMFGDDLDKEAVNDALNAISEADVIIAIGSTGEVYPACGWIKDAQLSGAKLIEINVKESEFAPDYLLLGKASEVLADLERYLDL